MAPSAGGRLMPNCLSARILLEGQRRRARRRDRCGTASVTETPKNIYLARSTRATARAWPSRNSCSQILITFQPAARNLELTRLSRFLLRRSLAIQNLRLATGIDRQRRQPCQKHPSRKTANLLRGKTTSGRPSASRSCPIFQPRTPARTRRNRNLLSVLRVPLDLLRLMTRERAALSRLSILGAHHVKRQTLPIA
jgi:hypothetical protein